MPDLKSREKIFQAVLRKTPIADNVDLPFMATLTDGFSGADITEMCQTAVKSAIRESIFVEEEKKKDAENVPMHDTAPTVDPVPYVTRKHFEEAYACSRKSVTSIDLDKFEEFKKKYDPQYAAKL